MSSENLFWRRFGWKHLPINSISQARMHQVFLILLVGVIICVCLPVLGLAQEGPDEVESLDGLVRIVCRDTRHVVTSPLRWGKDDMVKLAALSVGTFAMMITDKEVAETIQKNRTRTTDQISDWTNKYTKRVANLTAGGLYLYGLAFGDRRARETAFLCLESVVLAEGITTGLKHLTGRSRPFADKGAFDFNPLKSPPPPYSLSLPSGHATTAFAFCSVLAARYPNWLIKLASYGFAATVSLSRMNSNVHFLSDVFWGSIIGISVGRCLVGVHKGREKPAWSISFTGGPGEVGMGISIPLR